MATATRRDICCEKRTDGTRRDNICRENRITGTRRDNIFRKKRTTRTRRDFWLKHTLMSEEPLSKWRA